MSGMSRSASFTIRPSASSTPSMASIIGRRVRGARVTPAKTSAKRFAS